MDWHLFAQIWRILGVIICVIGAFSTFVAPWDYGEINRKTARITFPICGLFLLAGTALISVRI